MTFPKVFPSVVAAGLVCALLLTVSSKSLSAGEVAVQPLTHKAGASEPAAVQPVGHPYRGGLYSRRSFYRPRYSGFSFSLRIGRPYGYYSYYRPRYYGYSYYGPRYYGYRYYPRYYGYSYYSPRPYSYSRPYYYGAYRPYSGFSYSYYGYRPSYYGWYGYGSAYHCDDDWDDWYDD